MEGGVPVQAASVALEDKMPNKTRGERTPAPQVL